MRWTEKPDSAVVLSEELDRPCMLTGSTGVLLGPILYVHLDHKLKFFHLGEGVWCNDGKMFLQMEIDYILSCHVIETAGPAWPPKLARIFAMWTHRHLYVYGVFLRRPYSYETAITPGLPGNKHVAIRLFKMAPMSMIPDLSTVFMGTRLLVAFRDSHVALHEVQFSFSSYGDIGIHITRLLNCSGAGSTLQYIKGVADGGFLQTIGHGLTDGVYNCINAIRVAIVPSWISQCHRKILYLVSAHTATSGIFVTFDDDCMIRVYAAEDLLGRHSELNITPKPHGVIKLYFAISFMDLCKDLYEESPVPGPKLRVFPITHEITSCKTGIVALSVLPCSRSALTFQLNITTKHGDQVHTIIDLSTGKYSAPQLIRLTIPTIKVPILDCQCVHCSKEPLPLNDHPHFDNAVAWPIGALPTMHFMKIHFFCRKGKCRYSTLPLRELAKGEHLNGVLDLEEDGCWLPAIVDMQPAPAPHFVTPRLTADCTAFHVALQNALRLPFADGESQITGTPPPLESLFEKNLLLSTAYRITTAKMTVADGVELLSPLENSCLSALLDNAQCAVFNTAFLRALERPESEQVIRKGHLVEATEYYSLLHGVVRFYFGDLLEAPFLVHGVGDYLVVNPNVVLRCQRTRGLLHRFKTMFKPPDYFGPQYVFLLEGAVEPSDDRSVSEAYTSKYSQMRSWHIFLINLSELAELLSTIWTVQFPLDDSESTRGNACLAMTSVNAVLISPFFLSGIIVMALKQLSDDSEGRCSQSSLLADLVARCPSFVVLQTVKSLLAQVSEGSLGPGQCPEDVSQADHDGTSVTSLVDLVTRAPNRDDLLPVVKLKIASLITAEQWKSVAALAIHFQVACCAETALDGRGVVLRQLGDMVKQDFAEQILALRTLNVSAIVMMLKELRRIYLESEVDSESRLEATAVIWEWMLKPLLHNPRFNALQKLTSHLQERENGEPGADNVILRVARYFSEDAVVSTILGDCELAADQFLFNLAKELLAGASAKCCGADLTQRLVLHVLADSDFVTLYDAVPSLLESLLSHACYSDREIVDFIRSLEDALTRHRHSANGPDVDYCQRFMVKARLERLVHTYDTLAAPLAAYVQSRLWPSGSDEYSPKTFLTRFATRPDRGPKWRENEVIATLSQSATQDELLALYANDVVRFGRLGPTLTAGTRGHGEEQLRLDVLERFGLSLDERILQNILSMERLYEFKMVLTALCFVYSGRPDISRYDMNNYVESLVGIVATALETDRDVQSLVALLQRTQPAADRPPDPGARPPAGWSFAVPEVRQLLRKIRDTEGGGLGESVCELVSSLVANYGICVDSEANHQLQLVLVGSLESATLTASKNHQSLAKTMREKNLQHFFT